MKRNPVFSREMRVSSRSIRLPLILAVFNGILSVAALLNMYSAVTQVRTSAAIQYTVLWTCMSWSQQLSLCFWYSFLRPLPQPASAERGSARPWI